MPTATEQSNHARNTGQNAGANATAATGGRDRPLNPALRPQRLFHKVQIAMKAVDKKLFDNTVTGFSDWLSVGDMNEFRGTIRRIIRSDYDATFDSWPKRVPHNYVPDARRAIIQAMGEHWDMFDAAKVADDEQHDEKHDEFVPGELLYSRFYTE